MGKRRLRVLVDLSCAARGYCGIAQDVRLLYKTLALCPELEVTGLVYLPRRLRPIHKFCSPQVARGDRLENQACFLWEFDPDSVKWPPIRSLRMLRQARQLASTVLSSRVQTDQLDVDVFWDAIWRLLFSATLTPDDISLVRKGKFILSDLCDGMFQSRVLSGRRPVKLDTRGYDFLITQDARPLRISAETRRVVRYHDLIPVIRPDTMRNPWYIKWHHRSIRAQDSRAVFVCNSQPTRIDLIRSYPELTHRSTTIPYAISEAYYRDEQPHLVERIAESRRSVVAGVPWSKNAPLGRYIMSVSTLEPRKNFGTLIQAFNLVKGRAAPNSPAADLKLVMVGSPGWKFESILAAMRDPVARGELVHLEKLPADELRVLYTHAQAFVSPSNYEGFGIPAVEAMRCGTPVIASEIEAHRCVLGDAALFCNPYDANSMAAAIERLIASDEASALATSLSASGYARSELYRIDPCSRQWAHLFEELAAKGRTLESAVAAPENKPALLANAA